MVGFPALHAYIRVSHLSCLCAFMHVFVGFLPRMQVSSIEGRLDRQKSIRSKTATITIILLPIRNAEKETPTTKEIN